MFVPINDVLVGGLASIACLGLVLLGRGKGQRTKAILGGLAVALGMVAVALIADAMM